MLWPDQDLAIVTRGNVAEEPESIGFMAPFPVFTGIRQALCGEGLRLSRRPASSCASPRKLTERLIPSCL